MKTTRCYDQGCDATDGLLAVPNILGRGHDPRCYRHTREYFERLWLEHVRELHGLRYSVEELDDELADMIQRLASLVMIAAPRFASERPAWMEDT